MTPDQERERDRRLKLLRSAAASALFNGATEAEAEAAFREGMAEALASPLYHSAAQPQSAAAA